MTIELWEDVPGYDGLYKISNQGRMKSFKTTNSKIPSAGRILSPRVDTAGYQMATLSKNNIQKNFLIHRMVAMIFIQNPEEKPIVDHIDGTKLNNHVENLKWSTLSENTMNQKLHSNNTSGFRGVHRNGARWAASVTLHGVLTHLGTFDTIEQAVLARDTSLAANGIVYRDSIEIISSEEAPDYSTEVWHDIMDYPDYAISSSGRVRSTKKGRTSILNPSRSAKYRQVALTNKDGLKSIKIHRLVALHFIPNPEDKPQVDHIDRNPQNNDVTNLRWVTVAENRLNRTMSVSL